MYIVIYRQHGRLNCETVYYGPFATADDAIDYLEVLPAIGINTNANDNPGVKYITQLTPAK